MNQIIQKAALPFLIVTTLISVPMAGAEELSRTTLKVSDLFCGACITHIEARLKEKPGVRGVSGNVRQATVTVDHRPVLKVESIVSTVTAIGYPVTAVSRSTVEDHNAAASGNDKGNPSVCCTIASPGYRECGASASAWKKLFQLTVEQLK